MIRKESDLPIIQRADKLIDELYKDNDHLKEDKQFLLKRCEALEQLIKEYRDWFAHMEATCMDASDEQFYREQGDKIPAMRARAKALLGQETTS